MIIGAMKWEHLFCFSTPDGILQVVSLLPGADQYESFSYEALGGFSCQSTWQQTCSNEF